MRYAPERQTVHQQTISEMHQNNIHQQPAPRVQQNQAVHQHYAPQNQPSPHPSSAFRGQDNQKIKSLPKKEEQKCQCCEKREKTILEKFLPENIYNPKTKKLFGILSPEELLLASLILLFADSDKDDSNLLCLALLYLLFADKFDLSAFF